MFEAFAVFVLASEIMDSSVCGRVGTGVVVVIDVARIVDLDEVKLESSRMPLMQGTTQLMLEHVGVITRTYP